MAVLAILPYANAPWAGFVFDDRHLALDHPVVQGPHSLGEILTAPYWGTIEAARLWRPITTLTFALDHRIAGPAAWWPHLVNVLLHAGVSLLWFALLKRLFGRISLAFVAAALFAVHPLHTEAVTWVSGRAELLAAGFGILALLTACGGGTGLPGRLPWIVAPVCVLLAVGSKESAAVLPFVLLFSSWALRGRPAAPRPIVGLLALLPVLAYVLARGQVLGTWEGPQTDPVDNPLVAAHLLGRIPTVLDSAGRFAWLLIWPVRLSADYSAPVLGVVRGVTLFAVLGAVVTAALLFLAARRPRTEAGWGAGFTILTYALASNLVVVIGTVFAERLLYLPSAGLLLLVAAAAVRLQEGPSRVGRARAKDAPDAGGTRGAWSARLSGRLGLDPALGPALTAVLLVVVVACCARAWDRNRDYRSEATFYEEGARTQPRSPKMRLNLSIVRLREGRYEEALSEAAEAMRLDTGGRDQRDVYANSLDKLGRTPEAIVFLRRIVALDNVDRKARRRLIEILDREGQTAGADSILQAGLRVDPEHADWFALAGRRAQAQQDWGRAIRLWSRATALAPDAADAPLFLGFCYLQTGRADSAASSYRQALQRDPESAAAANGLAWSILEIKGDASEAVRLARQAVKKEPTASHYDTLARAALVAGDCESALQAVRKALEIDASSVSYHERAEEIESQCDGGPGSPR